MRLNLNQNYLSASTLSKHIELRTEWARLANRNPFRLPSSGDIPFSLYIGWANTFLKVDKYGKN